MKKYLCDICQKEHTVYYGSDAPLPAAVSVLLGSDEEGRLFKLADTAFVLDDRFITKGLLEIETSFSEENLYHYMWVEIAASDFQRNMDLLKSGQSIRLLGKVISDNPFLEDSHGLECELTMSDDIIGQIKILTDSKLKRDQEQPISEERLIEIMQRINHPEQWKGKRTFTKSFKKRLLDQLEVARSEYQHKGRMFVIDISNKRENLLQLVSGELLAPPSTKDIGIHISNDETNLNYQEIKSRMGLLCQKKTIKRFDLDGIETYQKDYVFGDSTLYEDVRRVIMDVFKEDIEYLDISIFES